MIKEREHPFLISDWDPQSFKKKLMLNNRNTFYILFVLKTDLKAGTQGGRFVL